ncbi:hypothetical protein, partial [Arthrobacter sp. NPDC089319]|uniref:hypothetical protein n=1 Tax=Arthrobacter sp. NPDC089319 TaxID=3155915 RepID=UPI003412D030
RGVLAVDPVQDQRSFSLRQRSRLAPVFVRDRRRADPWRIPVPVPTGPGNTEQAAGPVNA